jgi:hypothetical protein
MVTGVWSDLTEAAPAGGEMDGAGVTAGPALSAALADDELTYDELTDDELTALALACEPDQPLDPEATPLDLYSHQSFGLLPGWYMPPVTAGGSRRWQTPVVVAIIAAFLLIDALGLCITYGQLIAA